MGLEFDQGDPSADPIKLEDIAAEMLRLSSTAERLERTVGREACNGAQPTGLCAQVSQLTDTIGRAPNDATGEPGHGLCAVVARVASAHTSHSRKVVAGATLASGGVVAIVELVLQILKSIH